MQQGGAIVGATATVSPVGRGWCGLRQHHMLDTLQRSPIKTAPATLVGKRGIGKAVAQHDFAPRQCRGYDLAHVVAAGCKHEQGFGKPVHALFEQ